MRDLETITPRTISVDFDGTCVHHCYPEVGETIDHCVHVLKRLQNIGHTLILHTMRHERTLDDAIEWCKNNGIVMKYQNCNPEFETGSRKVYANLYIDDNGLGMPLIYDPEIHSRYFIDWHRVEKLLMSIIIYTEVSVHMN